MALIQAVGANGGSGSTATITSSQAGSTIIVLVGTTGAAPTVSDNLGTSYTKLTISGGLIKSHYCFYAKPVTGGVTTITFTSFGNCTAFVIEESGISSEILDAVSVGYYNTVGASTWTTDSVNVGTDSGVGFVFTQYTGGTSMTGFGVDSPWTLLSGTGITGGTVTNSSYGSKAGAGRIEISAPGAYTGTGYTAAAWYPDAFVVFFKYKVTPRSKFITPTLVNTSGISTGTWTTYSLSNIVPPGATGAIFNVVRSGAGAQVVNVRKNGSTDSYVSVALSGSSQNFFICGLDTSLQFQLYSNDTAVLQLYCVGYFNDEATFFNNTIVLSSTLTGSWTDYNLSANVPSNAIAAILTTDTNSYNVGVRKKGSTDTFNNGNEGTNRKYMIVGLDSNLTFQAIGYAVNNTSLLLVGYMVGGIVWNTNAIQRTISSNNLFTLLPKETGASGYLFQLNSAPGGSTSTGITLRRSGTPNYNPNTFYSGGSTQVSVGILSEFKTSNTADYLVYELGYFTSPGMRVYSNNSVKITNLVEVNGAGPKLYANGTFVCSQYIETP